MQPSTFAAISSILVESFHVDATAVTTETALDQLGLDSLALMEFVFAVEDRFDVRIPEERLDPRQAGVTLEQLAAAFADAVFAGRSAVRAHSVDLVGLDVPLVPVAAAAFDAAAVQSPSRVPLDRATAMALAAADEAARIAGLDDDSVAPERLGIFWGSGMAGASTFETTLKTVYVDHRRMRPTSVAPSGRSAV